MLAQEGRGRARSAIVAADAELVPRVWDVAHLRVVHVVEEPAVLQLGIT